LSGAFPLEIEWRSSQSPGSLQENHQLRITWNIATLTTRLPDVERYVAQISHRDDDQARRIEQAAVVVAIAVMSCLAPATKITRRSGTGTRHDYYLNERNNEMIEVKGRWEAGLPGLFEEAREQSELNPDLAKRWISVTVFSKNPRNRTEGLHP